MSRRRRKKGSESEDDERWILTYADMITLLLVFFIVLFSISQVQQKKLKALVESLHTAFNVEPVESTSADTIGINIPKQVIDSTQNDEQKIDKLYQKLMNYIKTHHLEATISLVDLPRGVQITFHDSILFDLGKANVKEKAKPILHDIGRLLKSVNNPVVIKGHTDNLPIHTSQYPSNWVLSIARANSVRIFLQHKVSIKPQRMRIMGFGKYSPKVPNDSKEHRARNRRVNIFILRKGRPSIEY